MNGVIDFYEDAPKNYRTIFPTGLICRAPIPFNFRRNLADRLLLINPDPKNPHGGEFKLERTDLSNFNARDDPSLRFLGLTSEEFLLSIAHKYRRCIIVSEPVCSDGISPGDQGFLVVPLYRTRKEDGDYKKYIDYEIILKAQGYQLNNIFYIPESNEFDIQEAFARLDRISFVNKELIQPKPIVLKTRALDLLREWIWKFYGFPLEGLDPALDKFIEEAAKRIDERLKRG